MKPGPLSSRQLPTQAEPLPSCPQTPPELPPKRYRLCERGPLLVLGWAVDEGGLFRQARLGYVDEGLRNMAPELLCRPDALSPYGSSPRGRRLGDAHITTPQAGQSSAARRPARSTPYELRPPQPASGTFSRSF